jgi:acetyl esterase
VLDPDIQAELDRMNAAPGPPAHEVPVAEARAAFSADAERVCGAGEPVAEVCDVTIATAGGGLRIRSYRPEADAPHGVVAYLHGGGWMMGTLEAFDTPLRALANASGAIVASIDYRLSPEHRFPAAVDDALAGIRWLAAHAGGLGGDGSRLRWRATARAATSRRSRRCACAASCPCARRR